MVQVIGKGQVAQKKPSWGKNKLKSNRLLIHAILCIVTQRCAVVMGLKICGREYTCLDVVQASFLGFLLIHHLIFFWALMGTPMSTSMSRVCFELTRVEIGWGRVEVHLTFVS